MSQTPPLLEGDIQRWNLKRKAAVILDLIQGTATAADEARQRWLTVTELELRKDAFLTQGTEALRSHAATHGTARPNGRRRSSVCKPRSASWRWR